MAEIKTEKEHTYSKWGRRVKQKRLYFIIFLFCAKHYGSILPNFEYSNAFKYAHALSAAEEIVLKSESSTD